MAVLQYMALVFLRMFIPPQTIYASMVHTAIQVGLQAGGYFPLPPFFPNAAKDGLHHFFGLGFILQYRKGIGLQFTVPGGKQSVKGGFITSPDLFYYQEIAAFQFFGLMCPKLRALL